MSAAASGISNLRRGEAERSVGLGLRTDSLAEGVFLLLSFTVIQRFVGFFRGILFCRWMSPDELGHWDLAFSFLVLAAPLTVFGLPGSFGRYVEYYKQRGQLRAFLRRTMIASAVLTVFGSAIVLLLREQVSWLLFGDAKHGTLVMLLAASLASVTAFNFLSCLFSALRQMRLASILQFAHSLMFATVGLGLLYFWSPVADSIVIAYGSASLLTSLGVVYFLWRVWQGTPLDSAPLTHRGLWSKLIPFAAWIWVTNLLSNLHTLADRYMIVHFGGFDSNEAAIMVGNYHSSCVVPMLMVAVAGMLASVILPHLSHDWEEGRRQEVSDRLNFIMKVTGLVLCCSAASILIASPILFNWILAGKYCGGLEVLPLTLVYCIWFSMCLVAQNYLWCAEKASQVSLVFAIGLVLNVVLNMILLPPFGLTGAVLATSGAMGSSLAVVYVLNRRNGMQFDNSIWAVSLLPVVLCIGTWPAAALVLLVVAMLTFSQSFFKDDEKKQLRQACFNLAQKLGFATR